MWLVMEVSLRYRINQIRMAIAWRNRKVRYAKCGSRIYKGASISNLNIIAIRLFLSLLFLFIRVNKAKVMGISDIYFVFFNFLKNNYKCQDQNSAS